MTRVVLITTTGKVSRALATLGLPSATDPAAVISWSPIDGEVDDVEAFVLGSPQSRWESAFARLLATNRFGRYARRVLLDKSRTLLRAVRSREDARTTLARADVIVAADRTAVITAWYASRHWTSTARVVNGVGPASLLLQVERRAAKQAG